MHTIRSRQVRWERLSLSIEVGRISRFPSRDGQEKTKADKGLLSFAWSAFFAELSLAGRASGFFSGSFGFACLCGGSFFGWLAGNCAAFPELERNVFNDGELKLAFQS